MAAAVKISSGSRHRTGRNAVWCVVGDEIAKRHSILHRLLKHMDEDEPAFIEPPFTVDYVGMPSGPVQTSKTNLRVPRTDCRIAGCLDCCEKTLGVCGLRLSVACWGPQGYNMTIGKGVYMNFTCCLLDCAPISIGDNVLFGPNVQASTPHPLHHTTKLVWHGGDVHANTCTRLRHCNQQSLSIRPHSCDVHVH